MSEASPKIPRRGRKGNFEIFRVITAPTADDPIFDAVERQGLTPRGNPLLNSMFGANSVWTAADLKGAHEFATERDAGAFGDKKKKQSQFFRIYRGDLEGQQFYRPTPETKFPEIYQNVYNQFQANRNALGGPAPMKPSDDPDKFIKHLLLTANYAKSTQPQKSKEIVVDGPITKNVRQVFPEEGSISFEDYKDHPDHPRFTRGKKTGSRVELSFDEFNKIKKAEKPRQERPVDDFLEGHNQTHELSEEYATVRERITDDPRPSKDLAEAFKILEADQPPPIPPVVGVIKRVAKEFKKGVEEAKKKEEPLPPLPEAGGK